MNCADSGRFFFRKGYTRDFELGPELAEEILNDVLVEERCETTQISCSR
ncbi:MAG: hypothetical protein ACI8TS_000758, partial [Flavobacteriales bacterium]